MLLLFGPHTPAETDPVGTTRVPSLVSPHSPAPLSDQHQPLPTAQGASPQPCSGVLTHPGSHSQL